MKKRRQIRDFAWATIVPAEDKYRVAFCKICSDHPKDKWPVGYKPTTFLADKQKRSRKNGQFDLKDFVRHENLDGHVFADGYDESKGGLPKSSSKVWGSFFESKVSPYENSNDMVVYLVWGDEPMSHIESWAHIQQRRGKDFPIDRERATLVAQACVIILQHNKRSTSTVGRIFANEMHPLWGVIIK